MLEISREISFKREDFVPSREEMKLRGSLAEFEMKMPPCIWITKHGSCIVRHGILSEEGVLRAVLSRELKEGEYELGEVGTRAVIEAEGMYDLPIHGWVFARSLKSEEIGEAQKEERKPLVVSVAKRITGEPTYVVVQGALPYRLSALPGSLPTEPGEYELNSFAHWERIHLTRPEWYWVFRIK